jgi:MoaA/NifB/PqqE/SkfB family radical SAM enzyme
MIASIVRLLMRTVTVKKYPTADLNAHAARLLVQGLPYFTSRSGYSLPPLSVFIHVNNKCNLKCKMCDAGQMDHDSMFYKNLSASETGNMPLEAFKHMIDQFAPHRPFIGLPATEPLLYPHIVEAVEYIKRRGMRCSVATNGTLLGVLAEPLIRAGMTKVVVSLDGPPPIHDRIRGVQGTYEKVLNGILTLHEMKKKYGQQEPYIYVNTVIQEDNHGAIAEMIDDLPLDALAQVDLRVMFYCTEELARKHNLRFGDKYDATSACLSGGINLKNVNTDIVQDQVQIVTRRYPGKCKFFFNHGRNSLRAYYHEPERFLDSTRCVMPWFTMQINVDGNVIPPQRCYHNLFGNVLEQHFLDIWNGPKMRGFRMDLKRAGGRFPACTRCEGVNF